MDIATLAGRNADRVMRLFDRYDGLTDFEIANMLDIYLSTVNATRNSLVRQGKVRATNRKRPSGRGGMATIWERVN